MASTWFILLVPFFLCAIAFGGYAVTVPLVAGGTVAVWLPGGYPGGGLLGCLGFALGRRSL